MKTSYIFGQIKKWLARFALAFMLGFSNAIMGDTKTVDDTFFKIEQREDKPD